LPCVAALPRVTARAALAAVAPGSCVAALASVAPGASIAALGGSPGEARRPGVACAAAEPCPAASPGGVGAALTSGTSGGSRRATAGRRLDVLLGDAARQREQGREEDQGGARGRASKHGDLTVDAK
jgi:hypothetical protein